MGKFGSNRSSNRGGFNSRRDSDEGGSSKKSYGGGNNNRRGKSNDDDETLKLGDISVSEKMADQLGGDEGLDEIRDSKLSAYVKVYPPKGVDEITIKRGDYINIRICKSKHGKERTIGFLTVSSND